MFIFHKATRKERDKEWVWQWGTLKWVWKVSMKNLLYQTFRAQHKILIDKSNLKSLACPIIKPRIFKALQHTISIRGPLYTKYLTLKMILMNYWQLILPSILKFRVNRKSQNHSAKWSVTPFRKIQVIKKWYEIENTKMTLYTIDSSMLWLKSLGNSNQKFLLGKTTPKNTIILWYDKRY